MATSPVQNRLDSKSEPKSDVPPGGRGNASCPSQLSVLGDIQCYTRQYIEEQPEKAALICLGVGFLLGWKLKPW